jgi:hypothetical protein
LEVPEAFAMRRDRIEALERLLGSERDAMRQLVREAHAAGVQASTLARWSGYTHRWIQQLVEGR